MRCTNLLKNNNGRKANYYTQRWCQRLRINEAIIGQVLLKTFSIKLLTCVMKFRLSIMIIQMSKQCEVLIIQTLSPITSNMLYLIPCLGVQNSHPWSYSRVERHGRLYLVIRHQRKRQDKQRVYESPCLH